jgi:hypothetical protein
MTESFYQGSCLCGGVRYEIKAPLQAASHCHCSMCRKAHGAAFGSYASVRREHHRFVRGEELARAFQSSARVTRTFCAVCGSPLLWHSESAHSDWVAVPLGTLDTLFDTPPKKHIYVASKASWVVICDSFPQYAEGSEGTSMDAQKTTHPRFNVFGRIVEVRREGALWQAYRVGGDGTRTPSGFVIPDFVEEHELVQFLEDLFHESASPHNGDVHRIA